MSNRVLIADHSPTVINVTRSLLRKHGYEVLAAEDGAEALKVAKASHPDVVLLNDSIPILDGEQVLKELKQIEDLREVPVVMLLSRDEPKRRQRLKQAGSESFINKPFDPAQILDQVKRLLSPKRELSSEEEKHNQEHTPAGVVETVHEIDQAELTFSEGEDNAEEALNIVRNSDLMESANPFSIGSNGETDHGFEWFLHELKKETRDNKSAKVHPKGESNSEVPAEGKKCRNENTPGESDESSPGFEDFVSELKYDLSETGDGKPPQMERSIIENMSPYHFDQLVLRLTEKIPQRIAQEVAEIVTSELLEKIVREEIARIRKGLS